MIRVFIRQKSSRSNLTLYYDDPVTGREVTRSAGTSDRSQAERVARDWENELLAFRGQNDDGWMMVVERFLEERMGNSAPNTRAQVRNSLRRYKATMQPANVGDVTPDTISRFTSIIGEGLAQPTVAKDLRHLKTFLRWSANVAGVIQRAPHVPMPKPGKRRFMKGRPLTDAEYRLMLKHAAAAQGEAAAPSWKRLLELLYLSGLRIDEAWQLSWDTPPAVVMLEAQPYPQILFYGSDQNGQKSGHDEAWPMPPDLAAWLGKTPRKKRQGFIAPLLGKAGEPVENTPDVSRYVSAIGQAAGIIVNPKAEKFASAHDLRRTFGTRWAMKVPPVVLQRLMRHATIETTMKYYVGLGSSEIGAVLWAETVSPKMSPSKGSKRRTQD